MEERFCQSCGMPMGDTDALYGTEADGSKSGDYCHYCYEKGAFLSACTMEEMIEQCVPAMATPESGWTPEQARDGMRKWFPTLKRWRESG